MKCPNCLNNLNAKFSNCPYCKKRLPNLPSSTISEVDAFKFDEFHKTNFLRGAFQFFLLISCIIALAFVIQYNFRGSAETIAESIPSVEVLPEAAANNTAIREENALVAQHVQVAIVPPNVKATMQVQRISILSNSVVASVQQPISRTVTSSSASTVLPVVAPPKSVTIANSTDSFPRRKSQVIQPVRREIPPAPEMSNVNSYNSELRLEVDASTVVLQKNIGLVSINSYVPARIYIDGQFSGVTPRAVKMIAGDHTISLMADGYREYSRKVKVDGHQQIGMVASMTKKNSAQVAGIIEE